jgi:hypothetical protein
MVVLSSVLDPAASRASGLDPQAVAGKMRSIVASVSNPLVFHLLISFLLGKSGTDTLKASGSRPIDILLYE